MLKKLTALLALLLLPAAALGEAWEGETAALSGVTVRAEVPGVLESLETLAGARVTEGSVMARLGGEGVFASQDGEVAVVGVQAGQAADGVVLEIAPLEKYTVHCTVEGAYASAETMLIHAGETVYIRCTADGSHRAVGVVTQVDAGEYRVLTLGGELYIGETVYLYRDADFTLEQRVGIGTVVASDTQRYESTGTVTRLKVAAGDAVERGQLLYELDGGEVCAPVTGIVARVEAEAGSAVKAGQALFEIVPEEQVCVLLRLNESEAAGIVPGQSAELTPAGREDATLMGTVLDVAWAASESAYEVRILPRSDEPLPLGMSVTARL
ncbi:MAG: HlyD family secretion protein [Clostridia bacterium]|nr:HlyD family secretion protein [Clostridia bacterium]